MNAIGLNNDELSYIVGREDLLLNANLNPDILDRKLKIENSIYKKIIKGKTEIDIKRYKEYMKFHEIDYITVYDENYPQSLRNIDDNPKLLYIKGSLEGMRTCISVVGARKCTDYAKWAVKKFIGDLTEYGVSIVSGLALGVDKLAHIAAMDNNLKTIGVLGCGIDIVYPASNRSIYDRLIREGGCILSEFRLKTPPLPYHFPLRNRIISGLSKGLIVIEAKEKSGTLITASYAANQGVEVFAVPGNINSFYSRGTNALIRDGAKILLSVDDIVEEIPELREIRDNSKKIEKDLALLSEEEKMIYEELHREAKTIDELSDKLKLPMNTLMSSITMLEIKGIVDEIDNKWNIVL